MYIPVTTGALKIRRKLIFFYGLRMKIRKIDKNEIKSAQELLPSSWDSNLEELFSRYGNDRIFHPLAAVKNDSLIGFGNAFVFGKTAWLGNINVDKEFRRQGIGTEITEQLIDYCFSNGATSINLIATGAGEPLYRKLGFVEDTLYLFYRGWYSGEIYGRIEQIEERDRCRILEINYQVTGEVKDSILHEYLPSGYKYLDDSNKIAGFYLPDYGNGLVLAMDDISGMELLKYKHHKKETVSVLSEENEAGVSFFEEMNFLKMNKSKRMYLGEYTSWLPQNTYSRGTTYTG